ncbi:MAG: aminopeptidase N [Pseudomonadota bacterium]
MRTETQPPSPEPAVIRLSDYTPPAWLVDEVSLVVRLDPTATEVTARLSLRPNPDGTRDDLSLDGEQLELIRAELDGVDMRPHLHISETGLTLPAAHLPDGPFTWTTVTRCNPEANTSLDGLYMSNGMYCTQCEAEGFRKITYYPDRPDVMARFKVRIEGDAPVMLSNGNPVASGEGWAEWQDPWPKPAYLFALVAGDLRKVEDSFATASGRDVTLQIWVRPGDEDRCAYAMDALKRSMRWDEEKYGREYDLDLFMIVAVDDFNMGAMENKGLNIFNSKYVLASPETATDKDFEFIEAIIAHEYFHNWTGNRITCRDWFQLCLKEGLTVFRDQQFTADTRSEPVKRIADVRNLRARQFREDAGPLAHPVRPEEYIEINNFYTATVYEKGAEVIRMLRLIVGEAGYATALDLYFERHDGQACTIEQWLKVFEDATGHDLAQFKRWYSQAGTPEVTVDEDFTDGTYTLTLRQSSKPTPNQPDKAPQVIPVAYGLLDDTGAEVAEGLLMLDGEEASLSVPLPARPVPSLLRGFSAPVRLIHEMSPEARAHILAHDTDPFNRWEAARGAALDILTGASDPLFLDGMAAVLKDETLDPAFRALVLTLPTVAEVSAHLAARGETVDPTALYAACSRLAQALAHHLADDLEPMRAALAVPGPYSPDAVAAGKRALGAQLLSLQTRLGTEAAEAAFAAADNMTEQLSALTCLVRAGAAEAALARFHDQWQHDRLVMDKWFGVQAMATPPEDAIARVQALAEHPAFEWKNPNRFRSLIGAFASGNAAGFHAADGSGYRLLADWLIQLDPVNPQTTARLAGAFETWRWYDAGRQEKMSGELERIASQPNLSKDTGEIIGRIRAA